MYRILFLLALLLLSCKKNNCAQKKDITQKKPNAFQSLEDLVDVTEQEDVLELCVPINVIPHIEESENEKTKSRSVRADFINGILNKIRVRFQGIKIIKKKTILRMGDKSQFLFEPVLE